MMYSCGKNIFQIEKLLAAVVGFSVFIKVELVFYPKILPQCTKSSSGLVHTRSITHFLTGSDQNVPIRTS